MAFGNFGLNGHLDPSSPERAVQEEGTDEVQRDTRESESTKTRHSIMKELARSYTKDSGTNSESKAIFESSDPDSFLNPRGEKFYARAWATNVAKVASERGQHFRQVGLCFQNLNVFGYGTPTDFQKDVGNVWLALPGMARRLLSSRGGQTRIDILRQFDGLIRPGEMCVNSSDRLYPVVRPYSRLLREKPTASTSARAPTSTTRACRLKRCILRTEVMQSTLPKSTFTFPN
jgi:hypothetical protein